MKLIILDRDGVINQDSDAFVKSPDEWIALPGSLQAIADTVELHILVDLAGAVTAGLGAAMLLRFAGRLRRRPPIPTGWIVQAPAPTRGR